MHNGRPLQVRVRHTKMLSLFSVAVCLCTDGSGGSISMAEGMWVQLLAWNKQPSASKSVQACTAEWLHCLVVVWFMPHVSTAPIATLNIAPQSLHPAAHNSLVWQVRQLASGAHSLYVIKARLTATCTSADLTCCINLEASPHHTRAMIVCLLPLAVLYAACSLWHMLQRASQGAARRDDW